MEAACAGALRRQQRRALLDLRHVGAGLLHALEVLLLLAAQDARAGRARRRRRRPAARARTRAGAETELLEDRRELAQRPRARRGGDRLRLVEVGDRELERDPAALEAADLRAHVLGHVELEVERELAQ